LLKEAEGEREKLLGVLLVGQWCPNCHFVRKKYEQNVYFGILLGGEDLRE